MCRPDRSEHKKPTTHTALTAWDKMVARAAPFTPMRNTKMNSGSSRIFSTAPMSTEHMAGMAFPWALIKVFRPRESCTKIVPSR